MCNQFIYKYRPSHNRVIFIVTKSVVPYKDEIVTFCKVSLVIDRRIDPSGISMLLNHRHQTFSCKYWEVGYPLVTIPDGFHYGNAYYPYPPEYPGTHRHP